MLRSIIRHLPGFCPLLGMLIPAAASWRQEASVWTFTDALQGQGPATLKAHDPDNSGWLEQQARFGSTEDWNLPRPVGGHTQALRLPAGPALQGLRLQHAARPNGVFARHGRLSNYSLIVDLLWPAAGSDRLALLNSAVDASDQAELAELALRSTPHGIRLGVDKSWQGQLQHDRWHRVVITVQAASGRGGVGQIHVFVDGLWVGGHLTPGEGPDNPWALDAEALLFGASSGRSTPFYLANLLFVPRLIPHPDIESLAGINGRSPLQPGRRQVDARRASRRVGIVAHRGNSCCAPENTLTAIRQALALGVEGIEIDVRLSADGHAVLMHDETLERTTDGQGRLSRTTLSQLRKLDAGSWFDPRYAGEPIPTLSEVLQLCGEDTLLYLDIKDNRLAPAIARALRETGHDGSNLRLWEVDSRDDLHAFRGHLPGVPFHWGSVPPPPIAPALRELRQLGVVGFELPHWQLEPKFLELAKQAGMPVTAYTIYDPDTLFALVRQGVDLIETDFPQQLQRLMPARDLQGKLK